MKAKRVFCTSVNFVTKFKFARYTEKQQDASEIKAVQNQQHSLAQD